MRRSQFKEVGVGGFFDLSTIKGTARAMVAVLLCVLMLWNVDCIFTWLYGWLGIDYVPATESMVRVRRFWAKVFFTGMFVSGSGNILWLYFYRRNSIKSARGQWYDRPGLTKEDLCEDEEKVSSDK